MPRLPRTTAGIAAVGALALALSGNALAAPSESAAFGQHVAACAQMHLGPREGAPAVTCTHDGTTMTFPSFGEMVRYMQDTHSSA